MIRETEREFQQAVLDLAAAFGWIRHHQRQARTKTGWRTAISGEPGFPDLVLVHKVWKRIIIAELKVPPNKVSDHQQDWLDGLRATQLVEVYVWKPADFDEITCILRGS